MSKEKRKGRKVRVETNVERRLGHLARNSPKFAALFDRIRVTHFIKGTPLSDKEVRRIIKDEIGGGGKRAARFWFIEK